MTEDVCAILPVKAFARAKRRLNGVMRPDERAALARLMLQDVLDAVLASPHFSRLLMVTSDPEAAALVSRTRVEIVPESGDGGLNQAITAAVRQVGRGRAIAVIPSDIPRLSPRGIDLAMAPLRAKRAVAIVSASRDGGTNFLACSPADAVPPRFGVASCRRHSEAARNVGIEPVLVDVPDIARDLDCPDDLLDLCAEPSSTRAAAFLCELDIAKRIAKIAADDARFDVEG